MDFSTVVGDGELSDPASCVDDLRFVCDSMKLAALGESSSPACTSRISMSGDASRSAEEDARTRSRLPRFALVH